MLRNSPTLLMVVAAAWVSGCHSETNDKPTNRFVKRAQITVLPEALDNYVGAYQLPSGVLFRVIREGDRLMAGDPASELLPQTTRTFASNRIIADIIFDRDGAGPARRVNIRAAKRDMWAERVYAKNTEDPTQLVSVGGHRLRMLVTGKGGPTIVVEDGFGSSILMRAQLQAELSKIAQVVTYDHAGTGGSDAGPGQRHAEQIAEELRLALTNAKIDPPYVMVGGSVGADYISVFTHKYPDDVIGIVRLDPMPDWEALDKWMVAHAPSRVESFRLMMSRGDRSMHDFMKLQEPGRQAEWAALAETQQQAHRALPLPDVPIVQITGAAGRQTIDGANDKVAFFDDWLTKHMPKATHVLAEKSGHAVYAAEPELVIREIAELLERIRPTRHMHHRGTPKHPGSTVFATRHVGPSRRNL